MNLFEDLSLTAHEEHFQTLLSRDGVRVERIVSNGQSSPEGFWYEQAEHEWVVVLRGGARLNVEGEMKELRPGDFLDLPAGCRHRIEWTTPDEPTLWLAVFYQQADS
jgi:cupin 2 domain-containing protein